MKDYKHLFETYDEGDGSEITLNTIMKNLTSPESLSSKVGCETVHRNLQAMKEALQIADVGAKTKEYWNEQISDAIRATNSALVSLL
jgi:hypothetical protein